MRTTISITREGEPTLQYAFDLDEHSQHAVELVTHTEDKIVPDRFHRHVVPTGRYSLTLRVVNARLITP